jgi:hypothetical protein
MIVQVLRVSFDRFLRFLKSSQGLSPGVALETAAVLQVGYDWPNTTFLDTILTQDSIFLLDDNIVVGFKKLALRIRWVPRELLKLSCPVDGTGNIMK